MRPCAPETCHIPFKMRQMSISPASANRLDASTGIGGVQPIDRKKRPQLNAVKIAAPRRSSLVVVISREAKQARRRQRRHRTARRRYRAMTDLPKHVDIHEEGPREGFQIE